MIQRGDTLYVSVDDSPCSGKVLCRGKDGVTVEVGGKRLQVKWAQVLGRKESINTHAKIVEHGMDGAIVEHEDGKRAYVRGLALPEPTEPEKKPGVWEKMTMSKALVVFLKASSVKGRPGLQLQDVTDKAGHHTKRWKKTGQEPPEQKQTHDPEDERGAKHGYGTHNIQPGDAISFKAGEFTGKGTVQAVGNDGATVEDAEGRAHTVRWHEVSGFKASKGDGGDRKPPNDKKTPVADDDSEPEPQKPTVLGKQEPIPAETFTAADYAKSHDQSDVTADGLLAQFPPDTKEKISAAQGRLKGIEDTLAQYAQGNKWAPERQALHRKILYKGVTIKDEDGNDKHVPGLLSPEQVKAARPAKGEKPAFIILGGRGGSGKSSFKGEVYQPDRCIVLDADHIKGMLPEYEGWNAHQVHEESGQLFDLVVDFARIMGLNVVLDKTMKTAKSAIADVEKFKAAGYRTEAHYMHLPRQEAGKRAVKRFLDGGEKGRFVPPEIVLSNTTNEESFDQIKGMVDAWSFHDNNVAYGEKPILISQSGDPIMKKKAILRKAHKKGVLFIRRAVR